MIDVGKKQSEKQSKKKRRKVAIFSKEVNNSEFIQRSKNEWIKIQTMFMKPFSCVCVFVVCKHFRNYLFVT